MRAIAMTVAGRAIAWVNSRGVAVSERGQQRAADRRAGEPGKAWQ